MPSEPHRSQIVEYIKAAKEDNFKHLTISKECIVDNKDEKVDSSIIRKKLWSFGKTEKRPVDL